jgi:Xaa-Pro aminopeptidase
MACASIHDRVPRYELLPFSIDEYRAREQAVRREMGSRGIDVLYVMNPANMFYLTGFESVWYTADGPYGVLVHGGEPGVVFLDYTWHKNHATNAAHWDEALFFDDRTAIETVLRFFSRKGWDKGMVVGFEWSTAAPAAPVVHAVAEGLAAQGAEVVSGDWLVDHVRLIKSPAEIECVRRAAAIVDGAFDRLPEFVRPGMTEIEIEARLALAMAEQGGERAAIHTMVAAGPDVRRGHGAPTRRPVERGDVLGIDTCGVYNRYHVDLCRTFTIGGDDPQSRDILDYTSRAVELMVEAVRAGDPLDVAQRLADDYIFARFSPDDVWWVGGYGLGIGFPPSWVGHTYLSNDPHTAREALTWQPGYLSNFECIVYGDNGAYYIDSLLMTESGLEPLSRHPRTLTVLAC